ncbi:hypothetical protein L226DRAFT_474052 [Lentinus tigrinus ALCF2SS1-7]|uniref:uncharacterized protein n=1 Tax=Lentinus tigrinus ALCF2SS1-7 TaxID=1328758 RepID=UPI001165F82A|nr:hypothetical protein L226DRAFT_474052 [Lentinus tigrinus ALCF2SS1-7]
MSSRVLNRRQARWSMFLSEFNFRLDYAPGLKNPADAPSRRRDFAPREGDDVLLENQKVLLTPLHTERLSRSSDASSAPLKISAFTTLTADSSDLQSRFNDVIGADTVWREAVAHDDPDFKLEGNLVFHKDRLYVPPSLRPDIVHSRHDAVAAGHPGRARTLDLLQRDYSWPGIVTFVCNYVKACDTCNRTKNL